VRPLGPAQNDINFLKINNALTNNPQEIANNFNDYDSTVADAVIGNIKKIKINS